MIPNNSPVTKRMYDNLFKKLDAALKRISDLETDVARLKAIDANQVTVSDGFALKDDVPINDALRKAAIAYRDNFGPKDY